MAWKMLIIKFIFNHFLKREKESILCLGIMRGGNFEILEKVYVITIFSMDRGKKKKRADCTLEMDSYYLGKHSVY